MDGRHLPISIVSESVARHLYHVILTSALRIDDAVLLFRHTGHANASRIFDGYVATVGHGGVLNFNAPPTSTGEMNASVVQVMHEAGKAINDTFKLNNAGKVLGVSSPCGPGAAVVDVQGDFDFIVTMVRLLRFLPNPRGVGGGACVLWLYAQPYTHTHVVELTEQW